MALSAQTLRYVQVALVTAMIGLAVVTFVFPWVFSWIDAYCGYSDGVLNMNSTWTCVAVDFQTYARLRASFTAASSVAYFPFVVCSLILAICTVRCADPTNTPMKKNVDKVPLTPTKIV